MIDYFALLDQPRAPWLEPDELKKAYHQKALLAHPDARASGKQRDPADATFATLNDAYQVLQDPKRRLQHLLTLEGTPPSSDENVPQHLFDLFPVVGAVAQRANQLLERIQATSNKLSRSLLKPEILELQMEAKAVREKIQSLFEASLAELHQINAEWAKNRAEQIRALSNLYLAFAYLTRWSKQLDEIIFQISLH